MNVQAMSNGQAINPQIIITFRGGMGMNLIPRIELKVTRSDGIVETGEMNQPFATGQSVTFAATTGYQDGPRHGQSRRRVMRSRSSTSTCRSDRIIPEDRFRENRGILYPFFTILSD